MDPAFSDAPLRAGRVQKCTELGFDERRVLAHFDLDCFYAQVEQLRRPELRDKPVGVTQKFLVVTCNYMARQLGVPKMASISTARLKCPSLVLVNGEDLTPYRAASRRVMAVIARFGTLEKLGLDEAVVDVTAEVDARVQLGEKISHFCGHVYSSPLKTTREGVTSVTDSSPPTTTEGEESSMSSVPLNGTAAHGTAVELCEEDGSHVREIRESEIRLMAGSHVAAEIRAAVEKETGYRCSAGIAHNKMLAKMACGLHKPNAQTTISPTEVRGYMSPLSVRKLPGVGHRMEGILKGMGAETVGQLRKFSLQTLQSKYILHSYLPKNIFETKNKSLVP